MKNRAAFLSLALLVTTALVLTACGSGDDTADAPPRPVVRLHIGDQVYEERIYSYCWPETADNLACDLDAEALEQPSKIADVTGADEVRFVIEGADAGTPQDFTATLLDGAGGVQTLGAEGVYNAEVQDGTYRVRVDVEYADVEGQPAYISYIYGLNIAGAVAALPTATPTLEPTIEPTAAPTLTPVPTLIPTATVEPTATDTPTTEPTATRAQPTAEATEEAGDGIEPDETVEAGAAEPGATREGVLPARPTDETGEVEAVETEESEASPTAEGAAVQTEEAPEIEVIEPTEELIEEPTAAATETVIPPTTAPTLTPRPTERPATVTPTTIPTLPPTATSESAAPELSLSYAGRDYFPVGYRLCTVVDDDDEPECLEEPGAGATTRRISLLRGNAAQLRLEGPRPTEIRIEYLTDTGIPTGQPEIRAGDNTTLFNISAEAGFYILTVRVTWPDEVATYFYRVAVTE